MEKFAVDLDKVLDEFEFKEDCAEQVSTVNDSGCEAATELLTQSKKYQNEAGSLDEGMLKNMEQDKNIYQKSGETINIKMSDGNMKSVNDLCKRSYQLNDKVQQKKVVDFHHEVEPVSLAIHNDISKLVQKKQNDNVVIKKQNSYDKKLNQPNIKPSVSNVFSSLNEYINASSVNMERIDSEKNDLSKMNVKHINNNDSKINIDQSKQTNNTNVLPEYQNILLPIKCELINKKELSVEAETVHPKSESHTYENVEVGSNESVSEKSMDCSDDKHTYSNVDFKDKETVYECVYLGKTSSVPEEEKNLEEADFNINSQKPVEPVSFSTIDDLSEEELNKYLADLEAEERAKEEAALYENISMPGSSTGQPERRTRDADEDADEAPIFENITIGELPEISDERLQEKARKFPVIDYSKGGVESSDFLEQKDSEKFQEGVKIISEVKEKNSNTCSHEENGNDVDKDDELSEDENISNNSDSELKNTVDNSQTSCQTEINNDSEVSEDIVNSELNKNMDVLNGENENIKEPVNPVESQSECVDDDKPLRPQTLDIASPINMDDHSIVGSPESTVVQEVSNEDTIPREPSPDISDNSSMEFGIVLGKQPPFWVPDSDAPNCMLCDVKFTVIKRRHHCRACGKVLCSKCCNMKYRLEYQGNMDSRVCSLCYQQLIKAENEPGSGDWSSGYGNSLVGSINSPQLAGGLPSPPTVMVPVGVLKREGSSKQRSEGQKSVMFSDGIRPGCDLTELDSSWDLKPPYRKVGNKRLSPTGSQSTSTAKKQILPPLDPHTNSYIPQDVNMLPPTVTIHKGQISYQEVTDPAELMKSLKNKCEPPVMFAINRNLYAYVKITNLNCCVNRICWNVTSRGLACVGQDEVIFLVETLPEENQVPKDLLVHINQIYKEAIKGNTITELGVSIHQGNNLLGSREHAGFLFIRQTFQCLQKIVLPPAPFLIGLLVHRWETPWAKVFPLRLVLRLGAEYRYYPCPLVSVRFRDAVYFEIGHTIMKVLADFRNYAYTLAGVRGLTIHMEDRTTEVLFPRNRYDQVIKGLNNSNDHVLAFAANFSIHADSHLVCIQTNTGDESSYQTQAINIHNKPRKITGASFIVINGALKSSMGLSAKSSIIEDGLMVKMMPEKMEALKAALKNMQDFSIGCGQQGVPEPDETVNIKWVENDLQFNLGVKSPIDEKPMDGIPSIRVHNGTDYMGTSRFIRWTEVFIIKSDDHPSGVHDPVDINKLSENIARGTCTALVKLLDLLATAGLTKLAVRATIHPENVGYEAGSKGTRLPPIYMNSLDNELIQILHKAAQNSQDTNTVLELIFHVLDD